jgi:hypothetical protein
MYDEVLNLFNFTPGLEIEQEPLMTAYEQEEVEELFK